MVNFSSNLGGEKLDATRFTMYRQCIYAYMIQESYQGMRHMIHKRGPIGKTRHEALSHLAWLFGTVRILPERKLIYLFQYIRGMKPWS